MLLTCSGGASGYSNFPGANVPGIFVPSLSKGENEKLVGATFPRRTTSPDAKDDHLLVARLKQRDSAAMALLYDRFGGLLYSVVYRAVRDQATAEDLVQETFFRIWNRIHTFDAEKGRLDVWLVTIARNRAFDHLRSLRSGAGDLTSFDELERAGYFATVAGPRTDHVAQQREVQQALTVLNESQREVIEMTHFEGMTQAEIADKLKKPLGTVKGLVRSALRVLREAAEGSAQ
jgi:RNA polymerase sigma-70 factor (ECF subfamily)